MTRFLAAHFDGKVIVPDEPVKLPVGKPLQIQVTVPKRASQKAQGKKTVIGLGRYASGIPDLASNKDHLKGLGK
jgi:hypothetical protein